MLLPLFLTVPCAYPSLDKSSPPTGSPDIFTSPWYLGINSCGTISLFIFSNLNQPTGAVACIKVFNVTPFAQLTWHNAFAKCKLTDFTVPQPFVLNSNAPPGILEGAGSLSYGSSKYCC